MTASEASRFTRWTMEYGLKPLAIAVCFVLVALLWTFALQHLMAYPFVFLFFAAIMGAAWFGGAIAGFIAVILSSFLVTYFFIPPLFSVTVAKESQTFLAAFILSAIAIAIVSSARKRAESAVRHARDQLEVKVRERTADLLRSNLELQERERQLRQLTEAIPQQIWSADAAGCIEHCNQDLTQYVGRSTEELQGEAFFSIFHPEDALPFRESWEIAREVFGKFEVQARIRGANGAYRWFLVRGIPQRDSEGKVMRWYGVHIDIEDQQRQQQGLVLAQEDLSRLTRTTSMSEMAASIAHELNQPLTALVTDAAACQRWLRAEPANLARANAAADRIVRESTRAGEVLRRVRSLFSKSDYVREPTDVNSLIKDLARLLRDDAMRRGVSIELRLDKTLPDLKVDPVQIQQVLLNLAINGMDAMMESDRPRVLEICSAWYGTDTISIAVKDRGRGFAEETQAKMFEPFFTTKPEGTGMGLSICRSIIEEHEGLIWASQSEQGAVVQFVLKVGV